MAPTKTDDPKIDKDAPTVDAAPPAPPAPPVAPPAPPVVAVPSGPTVVLRHLAGCPKGRIEKYPERTLVADAAGNQLRANVTVVRCIDCGAHEVATPSVGGRPTTTQYDLEEITV